MKEPSTKSAFTLVELLFVLFVIGVLAVIFLPLLANRRSGYHPNSECLSNQKQLAYGFLLWKEDHNGKFPWQVSTTNNGTMELVASSQASSQFKTEFDLVKQFKVYVCPTDNTKRAATNSATFGNDNLSYFVNLDAGTNDAVSILTGDSHLEVNGKPVEPGLFIYSNGIAMNWSRGFHGDADLPFGCLSFADGHVELVSGPNLPSGFGKTDLTSVLKRQGSTTNRLVVP